MSLPGNQSRIGLKAIRSTVAPMMIVLIVALVLMAIFSYRLSIARLEGLVVRLGTEHRSRVEDMLWQFDVEGLESQLRGFVDQRDIRWASVVEATGEVIEAGRRGADGETVERTIPLARRDGSGTVETLGSLTIQASTESVWGTVLRRSLALVVIVTASTAFVAALVMRQFNRNVLSPLLEVAGELRHAPHDLSELRIDLNRGSTDRGKDEIDELVDSVHAMRDRILSAERQIEAREARLAHAAQLAGLSYCTFDRDMERVIECDESYASLYRRSVPEMLALNVKDILREILDEESLADAEAFERRLRRGDREIRTQRFDFGDGESVYVRQFFVPIHDADGAVTAVSVIARDATEETLNQEILLQTQKSDAIGKLTGGVAHDFNNILAIIMGNVEMSIANADSPTARTYGETALEAVNLGARLTRQLLSFARRQPLSPVVLDAAKTVRDSERLLRTSVGESIDLKIVDEAGTWRTRADPVQLEAVLLNLVTNARDAMPSGGALTIGIGNARLERTDANARSGEPAPGDYVRISVRDSGEGMTPDVLEHAIDPFFTTKAVGEGTGLGLSMAFGFARQSSGHLRIRSERHRGTTVELYLPRARADGAAPSPERATAPRDEEIGLAS